MGNSLRNGSHVRKMFPYLLICYQLLSMAIKIKTKWQFGEYTWLQFWKLNITLGKYVETCYKQYWYFAPHTFYSTNTNMHTVLMCLICFCLWTELSIYSYNKFTYIRQDCTVIWLPSASEVTLNDMGKMVWVNYLTIKYTTECQPTHSV